MKHLHLYAVALLALGAVGCGGSGSSSSGNVTGLSSEPRIEAVVRLQASDLKGTAQSKYSSSDLLDPTKIDPNDLLFPESYGVQDPNNFQSGEQYVFELVSYVGTNQTRTILGATDWTSSDTTSTYGTLAADTGVFVAKNQVTPTKQVMTVIYQGKSYSSYYSVRSQQARVLGKVVNEQTGVGVPSVHIVFYSPLDPNLPDIKTVVGEVVTAYDGSFRASLPPTTLDSSNNALPTEMQVDNATVPNSYYRSFTYGGFRFDTGAQVCRAALPTVTVGLTQLSDTIQLTPKTLYDSAPSADGCF